MTDFKAPPPPENFVPAPSPAVPAPQPEFAEEVQGSSESEGFSQAPNESPDDLSARKDTRFEKFQEQKNKFVGRFNELPSNKRQVLIAVGIFVIGLLIGAIMFGGSDEVATPAPQGLQGVVSNPDIRGPLKRCGQVEASSACVLYVMNSYTYEKLAEDFFETAVKVTGRKDLVIRMDNVRYATMRIPPGYFAQIKIPAYK